jgi:hypothetical protein
MSGVYTSPLEISVEVHTPELMTRLQPQERLQACLGVTE